MFEQSFMSVTLFGLHHSWDVLNSSFSELFCQKSLKRFEMMTFLDIRKFGKRGFTKSLVRNQNSCFRVFGKTIARQNRMRGSKLFVIDLPIRK